MRFKSGKIVKYLLSLALAAVLAWFALKSVDWKAFLEGLAQTRWGWILLFFAASIGALVFRTLRWKALLKPLGDCADTLTVWDANNVGNIANVAVPGSGEFVRCGYAASGKARYDRVLGTAVMERIWDVGAIAVLLVLSLALGWSRFGPFFIDNIWGPASGRLDFSLWWIVSGALILIAGGVWAVMHWRDRNAFCAKVAGVFKGLSDGFSSFLKVERKWLFASYTVGIWTMYILMCFFTMKAVPAISTLGFADAMFLSAVGNLASVIPVPGGIGAYHYLVALTLSSIYGTAWETGILFATLQHELHAALIIALGIISYLSLTIRKRKNETDIA